MVAQLLLKIKQKTKQQIKDLESNRFQIFEANGNGSRADENCNADMIKALKRQLKDIESAIALANDLEHRANH